VRLLHIDRSYHVLQELLRLSDEMYNLDISLNRFVDFDVIQSLDDLLDKSTCDCGVLVIKILDLLTDVLEPVGIVLVNRLSSHVSVTSEVLADLGHVILTFGLVTVPSLVFSRDKLSEENLQ